MAGQPFRGFARPQARSPHAIVHTTTTAKDSRHVHKLSRTPSPSCLTQGLERCRIAHPGDALLRGCHGCSEIEVESPARNAVSDRIRYEISTQWEYGDCLWTHQRTRLRGPSPPVSSTGSPSVTWSSRQRVSAAIGRSSVCHQRSHLHQVTISHELLRPSERGEERPRDL